MHKVAQFLRCARDVRIKRGFLHAVIKCRHESITNKAAAETVRCIRRCFQAFGVARSACCPSASRSSARAFPRWESQFLDRRRKHASPGGDKS